MNSQVRGLSIAQTPQIASAYNRCISMSKQNKIRRSDGSIGRAIFATFSDGDNTLFGEHGTQRGWTKYDCCCKIHAK